MDVIGPKYNTGRGVGDLMPSHLGTWSPYLSGFNNYQYYEPIPAIPIASYTSWLPQLIVGNYKDPKEASGMAQNL